MMETPTYKWGDGVVLRESGDSAIIRNNELWVDVNGDLVICVDRHHYGGGVTTGAVLVSDILPEKGIASQ